LNRVRHREKRGCKYWIKLLGVGLAGGLLMLYAGYLGTWIYATTKPARVTPCCITPADLGFDYKEVTFPGADGVILSGWYIPSRNQAAVILLHGYGGNRLEMVHRAATLANHDYGVLLYDQRASGTSEGEFRTFGWYDVHDVPAAMTVVQAQDSIDPACIGLLGFSQGGQIALRATAEMPQIKAIVAEEPGFATLQDIPPLTSLEERWILFSYRLGFKGLEWRTGVSAPSSVVEGLARIAPRPILLMATGPQEEMGYRLPSHYYRLASEPKALWHVSEAGHGQIPEVRPKEYQDRVVTFFNEALLGNCTRQKH
jgi:pimeloyl-ACP methyl ester carboxylesterase